MFRLLFWLLVTVFFMSFLGCASHKVASVETTQATTQLHAMCLDEHILIRYRKPDLQVQPGTFSSAEYPSLPTTNNTPRSADQYDTISIHRQVNLSDTTTNKNNSLVNSLSARNRKDLDSNSHCTFSTTYVFMLCCLVAMMAAIFVLFQQRR